MSQLITIPTIDQLIFCPFCDCSPCQCDPHGECPTAADWKALRLALRAERDEVPFSEPFAGMEFTPLAGPAFVPEFLPTAADLAEIEQDADCPYSLTDADVLR